MIGVRLRRWVGLVAGVMAAASCAFVPSGNPELDQQRAIAAAKAIEVAKEAAEAGEAQQDRAEDEDCARGGVRPPDEDCEKEAPRE